MWRLRYWAVLGFMALLAIVCCSSSRSRWSGVNCSASRSLGGVVIRGYLFWKLVRVLSRIQMPQYPGR